MSEHTIIPKTAADLATNIYDTAFMAMASYYRVQTADKPSIDLYKLMNGMYQIYTCTSDAGYKTHMDRTSLSEKVKDELFAEEIEATESSLGVVSFFLVEQFNLSPRNMTVGCTVGDIQACEYPGLVESALSVYTMIPHQWIMPSCQIHGDVAVAA